MGYRLDAWHGASINAGDWLFKDRFVGLPISETTQDQILKEYEREFNCKYVAWHTAIEFETEQQYNWFILKWAY